MIQAQPIRETRYFRAFDFGGKIRIVAKGRVTPKQATVKKDSYFWCVTKDTSNDDFDRHCGPFGLGLGAWRK